MRFEIVNKSVRCLSLVLAVTCLVLPRIALSATASDAAPVRSAPLSVEQLEAKWSKTSAAELKKAAEGGNAEAQCILGMHEWNQAYEDNSRAFESTFSLFAGGKNPSKDEVKLSEEKWSKAAEADLVKAAEAGDRGALLSLRDLRTKRAIERGRKAFEWLKRAAEQSFPVAENEVAVRYLRRAGWLIIPHDKAEGLKWEERSASHGYEPAIHALADFYLAGKIVSPDLALGLQYLESAATVGCKRAQYELARHYASGEGNFDNDATTPVALLTKSAASGHNLAQHALAERYRTGLGAPVDYVKAIQLYHAAAKSDAADDGSPQTHAEGILELVDERFQPKFPLTIDFVNFAEVLGLFLRATEKQEAAAMNRIGELYLDGRFEPRDLAQAYRWFNFAAQRGYPAAAASRDKLKPSLTPEQLQEAANPLPTPQSR